MPIRTNTERIANRPDIARAKPPERQRGIATKERSPGTTGARSKLASGSPAPAWACRAPLLPYSPTRGRTTVARSHTRPKTREETSGFPSLAAASMAEHVAELLTVGTETRIDQGRQLLVSTRISEREQRPRSLRPGAARQVGHNWALSCPPYPCGITVETFGLVVSRGRLWGECTQLSAKCSKVRRPLSRAEGV